MIISSQAIIDPLARIGPNVKIGPFSIIGPDVEIDEGTEVGSHVVIKGQTKIGRNNKFYQFTSIGEDCQDKKYKGERTSLEIGDCNIFREGCTVHRGTKQGGGRTRIGSDNLFMVNTHVAHDCVIGNHVVFANGASIAGHVQINDYATLGGLVGVHQFCAVGAYSFAAGGSIIYKDVVPFVTIGGNPAKTYGLNTVGLKRCNFSEEVLVTLRKAHKSIFKGSNTVAESLKELKILAKNSPHVNLLSNFLENSTRGIIR